MSESTFKYSDLGVALSQMQESAHQQQLFRSMLREQEDIITNAVETRVGRQLARHELADRLRAEQTQGSTGRRIFLDGELLVEPKKIFLST